MTPFLLLLLMVPVLGALAVVFGRNARSGLRTGAVYLKGTQYIRADEPAHFWLAVGVSALLAFGSTAGIAIVLWALITLG